MVHQKLFLRLTMFRESGEIPVGFLSMSGRGQENSFSLSLSK